MVGQRYMAELSHMPLARPRDPSISSLSTWDMSESSGWFLTLGCRCAPLVFKAGHERIWLMFICPCVHDR